MLTQITLPTKWSYAPVTVKFVSYAPAPTEHPLYLRGGAVSLPSKAERLAVERLANSPSKRAPLGKIDKEASRSEGVPRRGEGV